MVKEPFVDTQRHIISVTHSVATFWPLHFHSHGEFVCVTEGSLEVEINGRSETLTRGDIMFVAPYSPHSYSPSDGTMRWIATFSIESVGRIGDTLTKFHPKNPILKWDEVKKFCPEIFDLLQKLHDKILSNDPLKYTEGFVGVCSIIHRILVQTELVQTDEKRSSIFLDAVKICEERYNDERFSAEAIAEELNISVSSLRQMFSRIMNMSVKQYITLLRVGNAEKLLRYTNHSVSSIALETGFGTIRTFNRTFLKIRGVQPTEYRNSYLKTVRY